MTVQLYLKFRSLFVAFIHPIEVEGGLAICQQNKHNLTSNMRRLEEEGEIMERRFKQEATETADIQ